MRRSARRGFIALLMALAVLFAASCVGQPTDTAPNVPTTVAVPTLPPVTLDTLPLQVPDAERVKLPKGTCEPATVGDSNFASGRAELLRFEEVERAVANVREARRLGVDLTVDIVGHTDDLPTSAYGGNQGLSDARAQAVKAAMIERGAREDWFAVVRGDAGRSPIAPNVDEQSRAANRRVEISFNCP